eukprot:360043-Chlamydomonas_euryale.AAC.2
MCPRASRPACPRASCIACSSAWRALAPSASRAAAPRASCALAPGASRAAMPRASCALVPRSPRCLMRGVLWRPARRIRSRLADRHCKRLGHNRINQAVLNRLLQARQYQPGRARRWLWMHTVFGGTLQLAGFRV